MPNIFVIATTDGRRPSAPQKGEALAKRGLETCKRGWPTENWKIFQLDYETRGKLLNPVISLASIQNADIKQTLFENLSNRCYSYEVAL